MPGKTKISKSFSLRKYREEEELKKGIKKVKKKKRKKGTNQNYTHRGFFI